MFTTRRIAFLDIKSCNSDEEVKATISKTSRKTPKNQALKAIAKKSPKAAKVISDISEISDMSETSGDDDEVKLGPSLKAS